MPLGRVNKMRYSVTNDIVGPLYVDLPRSPPALRVGLANLRPLIQISGVCIGDIDSAELLHTVRNRGLDLPFIGHVAEAIFTLRVGIGLERIALSLLKTLC